MRCILIDKANKKQKVMVFHKSKSFGWDKMDAVPGWFYGTVLKTQKQLKQEAIRTIKTRSRRTR